MTMLEASQLLRPTSQTAIHGLGWRVQGYKRRVLGCQKAVHVSLGPGIISPSPTLSNSPKTAGNGAPNPCPGMDVLKLRFLWRSSRWEHLYFSL